MGVALLILLGILVVLAIFVLARTLAFKPPVAPPGTPPYDPGPVPQEALDRLTGAIAIETVSAQKYEDTNFAPFDEYLEYVQKAFPVFHRNTERTLVNGYALVYRWKGADSSLPPMMLTCHYDVVPVEAGTEDEWTYPGFSGQVAEGRIWGRGTLDIKSQMTAHMEAAQTLMNSGFTPQRDFYFVYGHDEEVGGRQGAYKLAAYFKEQGIRFEGVLDEGGFAVHDVIRGVKAPLALIGIAEKGFCNYRISMPGDGGHSSMPPTHTALGKLSAYICKLENSPMPARLTPPTLEMLRNISGEMGFVVRMAVANLWLFRPVLLKVLSSVPATNALVRTTFAATMAEASTAANVLPQKAYATINSRLLPGDTVDGVAEYMRQLAEGAPLEIEPGVPENPSAVSPTTSHSYHQLQRQIAKLYPGVITTPYLVMGGTDARKYYSVCDNVYRFIPVLVTNTEKDSMHSTNESISVENYGRMIYFFEEFIREFDD